MVGLVVVARVGVVVVVARVVVVVVVARVGVVVMVVVVESMEVKSMDESFSC